MSATTHVIRNHDRSLLGPRPSYGSGALRPRRRLGPLMTYCGVVATKSDIPIGDARVLIRRGEARGVCFLCTARLDPNQ